MRLFTVDADPETGEWLVHTLTEIGETTHAEMLAPDADPEREHHDTFERDGVTCGILMRFVTA